MSSQRVNITLLVAGAALTIAAYWIGLSGPFVLDDPHALAVVKSWLQGEHSLRDVLFGNGSWLTNRALAMASFALTGKIAGFDPFAFKLVNLLLHLCTGGLIYAFLTRLLRRDPQLAKVSNAVSAAITLVWLLHPLHASTVLYSVQQMAQWAALACLLGLLLYIRLRQHMLSGVNTSVLPTLFVALPLAMLIGIQGKQNAAIMPALCLVVELAYFQQPRHWPRPLKAFFTVFVVLPAALVVLATSFKPSLLPGEYGLYDFSPWQRLMTETRVMWDYVRQIGAPHTPSMGVFTDGYVASENLVRPVSTLLAFSGILLASVVAWRSRRTWPSVFAGWFFFLVAHGVESTVLPLELYYEHRNYLPSIGILMVVACAIVAAGRALLSHGVRIGRVGVVAGTVLVLTLALMTHGRARVWSDVLVLYASELQNHQDSAYALISYAGTASAVGDTTQAYGALDKAIASSPQPRLRGQAMLFRMHLDCVNKNQAQAADLENALDLLPAHIDITTFNLLNMLSDRITTSDCGELNKPILADAMRRLTERAVRQPDDGLVKIGLRNNAARLLSVSGHWDEAMQLAKLGWQPTTPAPAAVVLTELLLIHGKPNDAQQVIDQASARRDNSSATQATLSELQRLIDLEKRMPGTMRKRAAAIVSPSTMR